MACHDPPPSLGYLSLVGCYFRGTMLCTIQRWRYRNAFYNYLIQKL